jgi:hypothetical protein
LSGDAQLDAIVRALDARKSGEGYAAKCPAHKDRDPSLSISKPNGKVLLKCHAGCSQDAVIDALRTRGVWPKSGPNIIAEYSYVDADGVLVFQVVRFDPKDFRQRRPDGMGGWIWNLRGAKVVPYNLPNVVQAIARGERIAIVEGEKDVENLRKIGITATANAGGAGKWKRDHSEYFRGAKVIILPDNDDVGRDHAHQVARSLAGIAAEVTTVELPGLPPKGDVSDWLANGGTREHLSALCARAPADPQMKPPALRYPHIWIDDAQVELTNDDYIKHLIGRRAFVLIFGPSGDGKTFFTIDLFAHIASGIDWRGRRVRACLVVYVAAEAGASIVRRFLVWRDQRLSEARAGRIPLAIITRGANLLDPLQVDELILQIRSIAAEAGIPVGAVILDTLSRSIPGGDENAAVDVTRAIAAADRFRDELGASTCFVHHSGKDIGKGARGHSSLFAAADTVISVADRVATIAKARDGIAGEQFPFELRVVELGVDQDGDTITTCLVVPADVGAAQKAKPAKLTPDEQVALDALREELGASGETLPQTSVLPAGVRAVRVEHWRQRFHARIGGTRDLEQDAKRQAWHRGRKGLIAKHVAACWEDFAWLY